METKINIRKAEMRDAGHIADFNVRMAAETEGKKIDPDLVLHGVKAVIKDPHKGFYLLAEKKGGDSLLVGQLMVTFEWSDWRNKHFWWIQSVFVDPGHRKQGIFSTLFNHLQEMARYRKDVAGLRLYVENTNQSAQKVYESHGMFKSLYLMYDLEF